MFSDNDNPITSWQDPVLTNIARQQFGIRPVTVAMPSATAFPRIIPESSAKPHMTQDELYFIPRRIPGLYQRRDMDKESDTKRMPKVRKESINLSEKGNDSISFKRPTDLRYNPEIQESSFVRGVPQMQFASPIMIPDDTPLMQIEDERDFYRGFAPMNTTFIPIPVTAPMLNQSTVTPYAVREVVKSLPQDGIRYIQPDGFVYSPAYYQMQESEISGIAEAINEDLQHNKQQEQPLEQQNLERIIKKDSDSIKKVKVAQEILCKNGMLEANERRKKIERYLAKRQRRIWQKKISYDCRKEVANKRLRVKGRFVTRQQAFELMGITEETLAKNESLKALIESNKNCSIITKKQDMKIRNIQKLLSAPNEEERAQEIAANLDKQAKSNMVDEVKQDDNKELEVVVLNKDLNDNVIEIRIDSPCKEDDQMSIKTLLQREFPRNGILPEIRHPIFKFAVVPNSHCHPEHNRYHKQLN